MFCFYSPTPCPLGRYCPLNTGQDHQLCPLGTYGPTEGLAAIGDCTQCDGGFYCGVAGSDVVTGPCYAGYWCNSGVDTPAPSNNNTGFGGTHIKAYDNILPHEFCNIFSRYFCSGECPIAHYCPEGTADPLSCVNGTYNGLERQAACFPCVAGHYCLNNASTYLDTPCPRGAYCPEGTGSPFQFECPAGTYNNRTHADDVYDCLPCTRKLRRINVHLHLHLHVHLPPDLLWFNPVD